MAPIRPRASAPSAGGGIGKKVHRKTRAQREPSDSWELLERRGAVADGGDEEEQTPEQEEALMLQDSAAIDKAMDPLREMAERVGREVETFAETLDHFLTDLPSVSSRFDAAHDLVLQFRDIATKTADELKKDHERDMAQQLRKEWSEQAHISATSTALNPFTSSGSSALTAKKAEKVRQLRQWQQEADIWELFRVMLELHPFAADAQAMRADKEEKLAKLGPAHRYTSEGDLWERFLLEDDLARERSLIKTWLEQTADHQTSDVQSIVEELEAKAGRGKGLWSSGWIHTREKIKGEKRLRTWPNASDSPLPQIRRSDNNELLVTTLDPDAPHRQKRTLEKPDAYFERAIWVACWEMLRRGKTLQEICDWCEERKEGWRALIMGGALDLSEATLSSQTWKHMCLLASQSGCATEYEAAVLGSIGGNVKAMERVSRTIDDHLYAHYSAALARQYDHYLLSVCPEQALPPTWRRSVLNDSVFDPEQAQQAIAHLISRLRKNASTSTESAQPMKIIQGFLLADEVGSLIHTVGAAIAETASLQGPEDMIYLRERERSDSTRPRGEVEVALNMQTLRITTHMAIIHRILSPDYLEGDELLEDENVLVAYIQALRAAGKRLLIPLYASQLQKPRCIIVLGRIMQDVSDPQEQTQMLRLLQELGLDVVSILQEQLSWILDTKFDDQYADMPLPMLEPATDNKMHPGQRIKVDFLPDVVLESDEAVIRALRMFKLLRGEWELTFRALTVALRKCLVTGRFVCARMIAENFPYADISTAKAYETIGRSINIMDAAMLNPQSTEEAVKIDLMKRQSRTYFELLLLVKAIEVLSTWRSEEFKYVEPAQKPPSIPPILKKAKVVVSDAMEPLIHGILLDPVDEAEAADLAHIRLTYLPEVVMAFITVLHAAGNLITREALLESMDLSVLVANGTVSAVEDGEEAGAGDNGLAELFIKAGRMRELMSAFAQTSKLMLVLKSEGRPWKPRKARMQRDLGIWELAKTDVGVA